MKASLPLLLLPLLGGLYIVYILWHVWQILPLPVWAKWGIVFLMLLCFALLVPAVLPTVDHMPMWLAQGVYAVGTSSLIISLYLFMGFLLLDIGRLCRLVPASFLHNSKAGSLTVFIALTAIFVAGNIHYHHKQRQTLSLQTEKALKKPLRMVMLSDLHLGYHNHRADLAKWIDLINAEKPDVVLIAGDIVDRSIRPLAEENIAQEFRRIKVPIIACLGNHEYYTGEPNSEQFYREAGISLLRDKAIDLDGITIVGRDDRTNMRRQSVEMLTDTISKAQYTILLDHQPYNLEATEQAGIDFQLSGHTHYGQVWPISWVTHLLYECAYGHHQRGDTQYYVSSGIGIWGGKFRIGTCSEYVVADLTSTTQSKPKP